MMSKNACWIASVIGPRLAVADRDLVDRSDRRDLHGGAREERLVGDVEQLARQHLFAHAGTRDPCAIVITELRVMPGRIAAVSGGV